MGVLTMNISPQFKRGNYISPRQQRGAVLVVGLILLAVMMMGALTMMQGSVQDERMTGNSRAKATAFMAADAGQQQAYKILKEKWGDFQCGAREMPNPDGEPTAANAIFDDFANVSYGSAVYSVYVKTCGDVASNPEVTLLSVGQIGNVEARSVQEFTISYEGSDGSRGGGLGGAINLVGKVDEWDTPNSNAFEVDGNGGSAVTTSSDDYTDKVKGDVESTGRINNYHAGYDEYGSKGDGGQIHTAEFPEPWGSPEKMQEFVNAIKSGEADGNYYVGDDSLSIGGNNTETGGGKGKGKDKGGSKFDMGSADDMRVTVIDGNANLSMKGNASGGGLLIVTGELTFSGTPSWDGLIVVLGGKFEISGGGNGGVDGSVYLANMDTSAETWDFKKDNDGNPIGSRFLTNGGGNATYRHNCDRLTSVHNLLGSVTPAAAAMWNMDNCEEGDNGIPPGQNPGEGNDDIVLSAWREKVDD
jgi:hypothetical protein